MIYCVYDKATKHVVKQGISSQEDCGRQVDDPDTQAVLAADTPEELATAAEWAGVAL